MNIQKNYFLIVLVLYFGNYTSAAEYNPPEIPAAAVVYCPENISMDHNFFNIIIAALLQTNSELASVLEGMLLSNPTDEEWKKILLTNGHIIYQDFIECGDYKAIEAALLYPIPFNSENFLYAILRNQVDQNNFALAHLFLQFRAKPDEFVIQQLIEMKYSQGLIYFIENQEILILVYLFLLDKVKNDIDFFFNESVDKKQKDLEFNTLFLGLLFKNDVLIDKKQKFSLERKIMQYYPAIFNALFNLKKSKPYQYFFSKGLDPIYIEWAKKIVVNNDDYTEKEKKDLIKLLEISYLLGLVNDASKTKTEKTRLITGIVESPDFKFGDFDIKQFLFFSALIELGDIVLFKLVIDKTKTEIFWKMPEGQDYCLMDEIFKKGESCRVMQDILARDFFVSIDEPAARIFDLLDEVEKYKRSLSPKTKKEKTKEKEAKISVEQSRAFLIACNYAILSKLLDIVRITDEEIGKLSHTNFFNKDWSIGKKYLDKAEKVNIVKLEIDSKKIKKDLDLLKCNFLKSSMRKELVNFLFTTNYYSDLLMPLYKKGEEPPQLVLIFLKKIAEVIAFKIECFELEDLQSLFADNQELNEVYQEFVAQLSIENRANAEVIKRVCEVYSRQYDLISKQDKNALLLDCCGQRVMIPDRPNAVFEVSESSEVSHYAGKKSKTPEPESTLRSVSAKIDKVRGELSGRASAGAVLEKRVLPQEKPKTPIFRGGSALSREGELLFDEVTTISAVPTELPKLSMVEFEEVSEQESRASLESTPKLKRFNFKDFAFRVTRWFTNPNDMTIKREYQGRSASPDYDAIWQSTLARTGGDTDIAWASIVRGHSVPLIVMSLANDPTMNLGEMVQCDPQKTRQGDICLRISGTCYSSGDQLQEDGFLEVTIDANGSCYHWFFRVSKQWKGGEVVRKEFKGALLDKKAVAHALQDEGSWQVEGSQGLGTYTISEVQGTQSVKAWIEGSGFYFIFDMKKPQSPKVQGKKSASPAAAAASPRPGSKGGRKTAP